MKLLGHERLVLSPRRPPRGGRGLKYLDVPERLEIFRVAPLAGGVD